MMLIGCGSARLLAGCREMVQVRRPLSLLRRHQIAVAAPHVVLVADADVVVALRADALGPHRPRTWFTAIALEDCPRMGQSVVDHRDVVEKKVSIILVEGDSFLDDGL